MPNIWHIYHIKNCSQSRPPKDKFVAIVCRDSKLMGFFVNSAIRPYVQRRPGMLAGQAIMEKSNHRFLNKDSYVDCTYLYEFDDAELVDSKGPISQQAVAEIKGAVRNSGVLEGRYIKLILGEQKAS